MGNQESRENDRDTTDYSDGEMVTAREWRNDSPPENNFVQDLIDREIDQAEKLPEESVSVGEIAKEPVVTGKTSQLSLESDSSSTILADAAAMGERVKQIVSRAQERFANFSGPNSDFVIAVNSDLARAVEGKRMVSELASDPSIDESQREALKSVLDSSSSPHRQQMQEQVKNFLGDIMSNPYMAEMQVTAQQALSDCLSNPHWPEMQQLARQSLKESAKNPYWEKMDAEVGSLMFGHPSQSGVRIEEANQGDASPDIGQEPLQDSDKLDVLSLKEVTTFNGLMQKYLLPEELKSMIIAAKSRVLMQQDPLFEEIKKEREKLTSSGAFERLISNTVSSLGNQLALDNAMSYIAGVNEKSVLQQQDELQRKYCYQAEKWFRKKELEVIERKERIKSMESNMERDPQLHHSIIYRAIHIEEQNAIISYENEKRDLRILELAKKLGDDRKLDRSTTARIGDSQEVYRMAESWHEWTANLLSNQEKSDAVVDVIPLLLSTRMKQAIPPAVYLGAKFAKDFIYNHLQATLDKDEPYNVSVDRSRAAAIIRQIDPHQPLLVPKLCEQMLSFPDSNESGAPKVINRSSVEREDPTNLFHLSDVERRRLGGN